MNKYSAKLLEYFHPLLEMDILSANHESLILICLGVFVILLKSSEKNLLAYLSSINILQSSVLIMNKMSGTNLTLPLFMIQNLLSDKNNLNKFCENYNLLSTCLNSLGKSISKDNLPLKLIKSIIKVYSMIMENPNGKKAISQKVPKTLFNKDFYSSLDDATKSYLDVFHNHFKANKKLKEIIQTIKGINPNESGSLTFTNHSTFNQDLMSHCSKDTLNYYFYENNCDSIDKDKKIKDSEIDENTSQVVSKPTCSIPDNSKNENQSFSQLSPPNLIDSNDKNKEAKKQQIILNKSSFKSQVQESNLEKTKGTKIPSISSNIDYSNIGAKTQVQNFSDNFMTSIEKLPEQINNIPDLIMNNNLAFYGDSMFQNAQETYDKINSIPFQRNQTQFIQDPRFMGHVLNFPGNFQGNSYINPLNPIISQPNINISNIYMSNYYNSYGNQ